MTKLSSPSSNETLLHEMVRSSRDLTDSTKRIYLGDINSWITFAGADPKNWTRSNAQKFYDAALERMTVRSANRVMASLSYAAGRWAKREANPKLDFSIVQKAQVTSTLAGEGDAEIGRALTDQEAQNLLIEIVRERGLHPHRVARDLAIAVVALETGMRRMSLESMRIQTTTYQGPLVTDVLMKRMKTPYPVALSETATRALEAWLTLLRRARIDKGPVWRSLQRHADKLAIGPGFTAQALYDMVCKHGEAARVDLTPHDFRCTFISWRTAAGWTPQQIASITGHQLPRTSNAPFAGGSAVRSYADPRAFWPTVSTATPAWLADFVRQETK